MIDEQLAVLLNESIRALLLGTLPILGAVSLVGILSAIIQGAMAIRDPASLYTIRLLAFIGVCLLMYPLISRTLTELAMTAFK